MSDWSLGSRTRIADPMGVGALLARAQAAVAHPVARDPIGLSFLAVLAATAIFLAFPQLDIWASQAFYSVGDGFLASQDPLLRALRKSSTWVLGAVVLGLVVQLSVLAFRLGRRALVPGRRAIFILAALALGPGLVVNGIFKSNWGRPRPVTVDLFGGDAPYQLVWQVSDWCERNCSFVSGEAASAGWFVLAAIVMVPPRHRTSALIPAIIYALALSLNRLAFGGHFLSDIVLSWAISGLVFAGLYRVMMRRPARRMLWATASPQMA